MRAQSFSIPLRHISGSFRTLPGKGSTRVRGRWRLPGSADLGEFSEWHDSERLVGNIHRAFSEIKGYKWGEKLEDELNHRGGWKPTMEEARSRCLA